MNISMDIRVNEATPANMPGALHTPFDTLSNHKKTNMSTPTLCYQGQRSVYHDVGVERLFAACHTYLDHVENIMLNHWHNNSDSSQQYTLDCFSQLVTTSGEMLSNSVDLRAAFKGMTVGADADEKTFESVEPTKCSVQITVSPNSDVWLYQRRYTFHTKMTWVLDSWGELCNVGSQGGYHIQEGTSDCMVYTQDFVTTKNMLADEQTVTWPGKAWMDLRSDGSRRAETTKKFEEMTTKAKNALTNIRINGSQQR